MASTSIDGAQSDVVNTPHARWAAVRRYVGYDNAVQGAENGRRGMAHHVERLVMRLFRPSVKRNLYRVEPESPSAAPGASSDSELQPRRQAWGGENGLDNGRADELTDTDTASHGAGTEHEDGELKKKKRKKKYADAGAAILGARYLRTDPKHLKAQSKSKIDTGEHKNTKKKKGQG